MPFSVQDVLRMEVAPALGCTEPAAVALGAAAAATVLEGEPIVAIEVWVDANVYKNGIAVSIPGTEGLTGLDTASALGALGGDATLRLEVLAPVDAETVARAQALLRAGKVKVMLLHDQPGPYVRTRIHGAEAVAESVVQGAHDHVVALSRNGQAVTGSPLLAQRSPADTAGNGLGDLDAWLRERSLPELVAMVDELTEADFRFLEEGVQVNLRLADHGLKTGCGLGVGKTLERLVRQRLIQKDMILAARILTSAAADARMSGAKLPAMSSAGSGNHGLTAVLPIWAVKDYVTCDDRTVLEAIALSHIITGFVKAYTGRLSAVCGCSIAAGAGATAGVTYLLGGDTHHIAAALKNLTGDLAGVICDGAKAGCALKLATAAGSAVQAALFALQGVEVHETDGIIDASPERTLRNIGTLSTEGMIATDRTILGIMMAKRFTGV